MIRKSLPPYGKALQEQIAVEKKLPHEIWLFYGPLAWRYAKHHYLIGKAVLVIPQNKAPQDYTWPVRNIPILVFDLHPTITEELEQRLKRLAWELLNAGAEIVRLIQLSSTGTMTIFYREKNRLTARAQ